MAINAGTLVISGAGFDVTPANDTVQFNDGAVGTVTAATATQLTVTFSTRPATAGNLYAVVTTDGQSSGSPVQVATVLPPTVQFIVGSESVNESAGSFSVPVTLTANPSFAGGASPAVSTFASGFNTPEGLTIDSAGNLYVTNGVKTVRKVCGEDFKAGQKRAVKAGQVLERVSG